VRVDPALVAAVGAPPDDDAILADVFSATLEWADGASDDAIFESRDFVAAMLDWGTHAERWADVILLARRTDQAMAVGGRHGAWRHVLESALVAARRVEPTDVATEAWALHQLGSMALLRDELDDARELLHGALEKREAIGDREGAEVSRQNLGLVPMALVSVATLILILLGVTGWIVTTLLADRWAPSELAQEQPTTTPSSLPQPETTIGSANGTDDPSNEPTMPTLAVLTDSEGSLILTGQSRLTFDADGDGAADAGDEVTFDYEISSHSELLENLTLSESLAGMVELPGDSLDADETMDTSSVHVISQAEFDVGTLVNVVSVTATADSGQQSAETSIVVPLAPQQAGMTVDIDATLSAGAISYTYSVTNSGNVTLSGVRVTDTRTGTACSLGEFAPSGESDCRSDDFTPTGAELDDRQIANVVTVAAVDPGGATVEREQSVSVSFGVLTLSAETTTEPAASTLIVHHAGKEYDLLAGPPVQIAVPGTSARSTEIITVELEDDWTLTDVSCSGVGPRTGPAAVPIAVSVPDTGDVDCGLQITGRGVIEIVPNVLTLPPDSFEIHNVGTAAVALRAIEVDPSGAFEASTDCGVTLTPGEPPCEVTVLRLGGASLGIIELAFDGLVTGDSRVIVIAR
jgi:hypothetical protein